jgi:hypothetical protein
LAARIAAAEIGVCQPWPPDGSRPAAALDDLERGDKLRALGVDNDVPAEQHAEDNLPGMRGSVLQADDGAARTSGIGYCRHPGNSPPP